jgi:anti-anti-sigma factor
MSKSTEIQVTRTDDGVIIISLPAGALDEESLEATKHKIYPLVDGLGTSEMRVDLAHVTALGSSALGMLLTLHRRAAQGGGHLALCGLAPNLQQLIRLIRLDTILDVRT